MSDVVGNMLGENPFKKFTVTSDAAIAKKIATSQKRLGLLTKITEEAHWSKPGERAWWVWTKKPTAETPECAVCGSVKDVRDYSLRLYDYGVSVYKQRKVCERCIKAHKKGVL